MRRRVVVTMLAAGVAVLGVAAPISSSASEPEKGVARMAAANEQAQRTGRAATIDTVPDTVPPPPSPTFEAEAEEVLALVNRERTSRGLQPLVLEARLVDAAEEHTRDQASVGDIYHRAPNGEGPGDRIAATGYRFSTWGENVAAGQQDAESVMSAWMNSAGHCRNILNPAYTELGVGYERTTNSYRVWWTQKFARPKGAEVPPGTYNPAWC